MTEYRIEKDSMGAVRVPAGAYYGAQSQRAVENFPVSGRRMPLPVVHAAALVKGVAAEVNAGLGLLPPALSEAISRAAREASLANPGIRKLGVATAAIRPTMARTTSSSSSVKPACRRSSGAPVSGL